MLTRDLVTPLAVAGAIGVPILLSSGGPAPEGRHGLDPAAGQWGAAMPYGGAPVRYFPGDQLGPDLTAPPLEFLPVSDLARVFSLELDPETIRQQFPRLAIVAGDNGWQGVRTELVTGTSLQDLHGCITWYFDRSNRIQRISFRGWAGDVSNLRLFLESSWNMKSCGLSGWTETLVSQGWGQPVSAAILQQATVTRPDLPQQQIAVLLELNRSGSGAALSQSTRDILATGARR